MDLLRLRSREPGAENAYSDRILLPLLRDAHDRCSVGARGLPKGMEMWNGREKGLDEWRKRRKSAKEREGGLRCTLARPSIPAHPCRLHPRPVISIRPSARRKQRWIFSILRFFSLEARVSDRKSSIFRSRGKCVLRLYAVGVKSFVNCTGRFKIRRSKRVDAH